MSKLGTANTVKYVKRPSSGGKDIRPGSIGHSGKVKLEDKKQRKGQ